MVQTWIDIETRELVLLRMKDQMEGSRRGTSVARELQGKQLLKQQLLEEDVSFDVVLQ